MFLCRLGLISSRVCALCGVLERLFLGFFISRFLIIMLVRIILVVIFGIPAFPYTNTQPEYTHATAPTYWYTPSP